ncbi:hypothetical protein [Mycobacterium sp. E802]|uniref:hypothetical protein n=1 Tax=Mycobacterium sp. E802 TaxID=1834152 RepID=UPI002688D7CD
MIADNSAAYAQLYYAVPHSGCVLTLINQRLSPAEQAVQLATAAPRLVLGVGRAVVGDHGNPVARGGPIGDPACDTADLTIELGERRGGSVVGDDGRAPWCGECRSRDQLVQKAHARSPGLSSNRSR